MAPWSDNPSNVPAVGDGCWFAESVSAPFTVVMLDPLAREMLRAVVSATVPVPLVARSLAALGRLIVLDASPERFLFDASVIAPLKVSVLKGFAPVPIVKLEVRSGNALTIIVSAELPRLMVTEPVGLEKSVASNVAPLKRDMP